MNAIGTVCVCVCASMHCTHTVSLSHSRSPNALLLHEIYALLHTRLFPLPFWLIGCYGNTHIKYTNFSPSLALVCLCLCCYRVANATFINFEWRSKTTTAAAAANNDKSNSKRLADDDDEKDDPTISNALFGYSYKIFCNKWHVLFSCTRSFRSFSLSLCLFIVSSPFRFCPLCIHHCHGT